MHEMAICAALIRQIESEAGKHRASGVEKVVITVGPLSGVEPELLKRAFSIAKENTLAHNAELECKEGRVRVACTECNKESDATINTLVCGECGSWRTRVVEGDSLLLNHVYFSVPASHPEHQ